MCPRLFSVVIEIRVMLPDHLISQFNNQVPRNHEGFRGTLWKPQELISNCQTVAYASHSQDVLGLLGIRLDEFA